ncbi:MAG: FAD-dependent oxidoreductase [Miltoncostaeaceae bacterium]
MRIAVVGAGLAGIAAARTAAAAGHEVVVVEKSRGIGGRVASRRVEGTVVDHGSPAIWVEPGSALAEHLASVEVDGVHRVPEGIATPAGASAPLKALAAGLDIRLGVRLHALRPTRSGYELADEQGNSHGSADAVVVTAPGPQAADLLAGSGEPDGRVAAIRALGYLPAVMVLAGVRCAVPEGPVDPAEDGPLAQVRGEGDKGRPAIDGVHPLVARLADQHAGTLLDCSDEEVLAVAMPALARLLGDGAADPAWAQVKRWRFAVPRGTLTAAVAAPSGTRIVLAGEVVAGASFGGRHHSDTYASGLAAARTVMEAG